MDAQIEKLAPKSKSRFVRKAIEEKIRREIFQKLETQWIEALKKHPEREKEFADWVKAETWGAR